MNKLLVVCGSTATGKTKLALRLAKRLASSPVSDSESLKTRGEGSGPVGELISADSRQVYKGMDIGTGKDIPKDYRFKISDLRFKKNKIGYYTDGEIRIWGYDLVGPSEEFSVAQFTEIARRIIKNIWERGKLPILVGGTGLYIQGVVDGIETSSVPKDEKLRKSLEEKSSNKLLELLTGTDPVKAASLNISDRKNPRRLIRAIEVSNSRFKIQDSPAAVGTGQARFKIENTLFIGLKTKKQVLDKLIENRVEKRIKKGFEKELKDLLENGLSWNAKSMSSMGYQQYKDYAFGRTSKDVAILNWKRAEKKYAKRQITWFKRDKRINWFDISEEKWQEKIEKLVNKWYKVE